MMTDAVIPTHRRDVVLWAALALAAGIAVGSLPLGVAAAMLTGCAIMLVVLIEPVLALILMLLIAPLKTLLATEAPASAAFDPGMAGLALVIVAWLMWRVWVRHDLALPRTRVMVPVLVIIAGFSPSLVNAVSPEAWVGEMLKWGAIALLILIVLDLGHGGRWAWIAFGVVLSAAVQAIIGLYEFLGGAGAAHLWIADYRFFRAFGTFGQPNPFSAFMGLTLPLALGLTLGYARDGVQRARAAQPGTDWHRSLVAATFYAACSLLLFAALIASWGRGAWLGFGAAAAVMAFFAPVQRWQSFALLAVGIVIVLLVWLGGLVPASIEGRIANALTEFTGFRDVRGVYVNDDNYAIIERLAHWQAALNMADAHPVVGVGAGNYDAAYATYSLPSWPRALGHAHNEYLNILAETGLVGLIPYVTGWSLLVYWTLRARRQTDAAIRGLVIGLLGTWTHLTVHSFVDKLYVNNLFLHIGVMLGLLAIAHRHHLSLGIYDEHSHN